jgi:integrase
VFYRLRKKIAYKLGNPRLLEIGFHTFRHWKATMLYHETRDPVLVKEFLGHKTLETTLLYIQLEKALFKEESNEFIVRATKDSEEIQGLLETGFDYVCERKGLMFFRKRK